MNDAYCIKHLVNGVPNLWDMELNLRLTAAWHFDERLLHNALNVNDRLLLNASIKTGVTPKSKTTGSVRGRYTNIHITINIQTRQTLYVWLYTTTYSPINLSICLLVFSPTDVSACIVCCCCLSTKNPCFPMKKAANSGKLPESCTHGNDPSSLSPTVNLQRTNLWCDWCTI